MSAELIRQLRRLQKVARLADYDEALTFLGGHLRDLQKDERERPWPLGRCMECWVEHRRLREAIALGPGGGFPYCDEHLEDLYVATEGEPMRQSP
jgi:hypothetical protein